MIISNQSMIKPYKHIWISNFDFILESIFSQYFILKMPQAMER